MNNLKKLRLEKGLTLRELGELTNISFSSISSMENEIRPFTQTNLEILCDFFGVSSDYLLGKTDVRNDNILSNVDVAFYEQHGIVTDAQKQELKNFIDFLNHKEQEENQK